MQRHNNCEVFADCDLMKEPSTSWRQEILPVTLTKISREIRRQEHR